MSLIIDNEVRTIVKKWGVDEAVSWLMVRYGYSKEDAIIKVYELI